MKTIYIPSPRKIDAYRDADYLYSYRLGRLSEFCSGFRTVRSNSLAFDFRFYARLFLTQAKRRLHAPVPRRFTWLLSQFYRMPTRDEEVKQSDAVLAYERYPINAGLPVIWMAGSTDVIRQRRCGVSEADIQREIDFKYKANALAAVTLLPTRSKKQMFDSVIRPSKPTRVIPLFHPLEPIPLSSFQEKWRNLSVIKLLFIGRAARRKGLPLVLEAFAELQARYLGRFSLHVVSTFQDGPVEMSNLPGLTLDASTTHARAMALLAESHYLLMPSEFEEYGLVYVEAMASGTIPLATDAPVQRDLLDEGRAGLLVPRTASAIAQAVAVSVQYPQSAKAMASHAMNFWRRHHAPEVVASQFHSVVSEVLSQECLQPT